MSNGKPEEQGCILCGTANPRDYSGRPPLCDDHTPDEEPESDGEGEQDQWADDIEFSSLTPDTWPRGGDIPQDYASWMVQKGKKPYAPWGPSTHPDVPEDEDPRWKWVQVTENREEFEEAKEWMEMDPSLDDGLAFLSQKPEDPVTDDPDPFLMIDGDDVRNPETGEVVPEFIGLLNRFEPTYLDVSQSGEGIHAYYRGELPEGVKAVQEDLRSRECEWKDTTPAVEMYYGGRQFIMTGEKVADAPGEIADVGEGALADLVDDIVPEEKRRNQRRKAESSYDPDENRDLSQLRESLEKEEVDSWDEFKNAIDGLTPSDVHLWSTKTQDRSDGSSWDPSFPGVHSESGTRLWYYGDGGWNYRAGDHGLTTLQVIACEEGIIKPGYPLEGDDFWEAVDAARERGAPIPEYDPSRGADTDPVSMIPGRFLDRFSAEKRRRFAQKRGVEWPSADEVQDRLAGELCSAVEREDVVVIDSPTGSGKTYTTATTPWLNMDNMTGGQPVVHALPTRAARDEAYRMAEENGLDAYRLKSRSETCSVARGDYDPGNAEGNIEITVNGEPVSLWIDYWCDTLGFAYSFVHTILEENPNVIMPCEHDGECPSKQIFDGIPRNDAGEPSYDVIFCTHQFLHVPGLRMHTNIVVDEKPDFSTEIDHKIVKESVNKYLSWVSGQPDTPDALTDHIDHFHDLVVANKEGVPPEYVGEDVVNGSVQSEWAEVFSERMDTALRQHPGRSWYVEQKSVHALAPAFARALWEAEEVADGRYAATVSYDPPRMDDQAHDADGWNREQVTVVFDQNWSVEAVWSTPDFSLARSVVGLDATAHLGTTAWLQNVHRDIDRKLVLNTTERKLYRRYERQLRVVQIGDYMNPVTKEKYVKDGTGRKYKATVKHLREMYGEEFSTGVTGKTARSRLCEWMDEAGIEDPELMHYGDEESRNDFEGEKYGYVCGAIDPGDRPVMNLIAALGLHAEPERVNPDKIDGSADCEKCGGSGCTDCSGTGLKREHGRSFVGEDAESAEEVVREVTEHHVVQSAGRYARDVRDGSDHATVYVHTNRVPDEFVDVKLPSPTWVTNEEQQERLEYVRDSPEGTTAREVAEETGCSKQASWRTLSKAAENGMLEAHEYAGAHGATIYTPTDDFTTLGTANLSLPDGETVTDDVSDRHTFTVMVERDSVFEEAGQCDTRRGSVAQTAIGPFAAYRGPTRPPSS